MKIPTFEFVRDKYEFSLLSKKIQKLPARPIIYYYDIPYTYKEYPENITDVTFDNTMHTIGNCVLRDVGLCKNKSIFLYKKSWIDYYNRGYNLTIENFLDGDVLIEFRDLAFNQLEILSNIYRRFWYKTKTNKGKLLLEIYGWAE